MPTLDRLFPPDALARALAAGLVRAQTHPTEPLTIYNYTEACAYAGVWDEVTLACRGLILHQDGRVVARPYPKFFNHGQPGSPVIGLDEPVRVTDKADGSLGVVYLSSDGPAVATRGSFTSDQARHATALLRERYHHWAPPAGLTVLVEIIYPGNRIVLDYGRLDDLMLLGAVEIATGRTFGPEAVPDWPGSVVDSFDYPTYGAALAAPARDNREGLVVHVLSSDLRVKIKYAEYVALHKVITGLTARRIWEDLGSGLSVAEIAAPLPDEFHDWVKGLALRFENEVAELRAEIEAELQELISGLPEGWTRKDFAMAASRRESRGFLFARLDGKPIDHALWQAVKPTGDETPHGRHIDEE